MISTVTAQYIDPGVKYLLDNHARCCGVLMEEFVYCLIHEYRAKAEGRIKPSEAFKLYFDPKHRVDLLPPGHVDYRTVAHPDKSRT